MNNNNKNLYGDNNGPKNGNKAEENNINNKYFS